MGMTKIHYNDFKKKNKIKNLSTSVLLVNISCRLIYTIWVAGPFQFFWILMENYLEGCQLQFVFSLILIKTISLIEPYF